MYLMISNLLNNLILILNIMTNDKRKFKRKEKQNNPTNPTGNTEIDTNKLDIDKKTIKKQQNKDWGL